VGEPPEQAAAAATVAINAAGKTLRRIAALYSTDPGPWTLQIHPAQCRIPFLRT